MFEQETKEIKEKLKRTLTIYDKMAKLHNEYWNDKADNYFYFQERIDGRHIIYTRALEALKRLMESEAGIKCSFDPQAHNNFAAPEVEAAIKKVKSIKTDDVLNAFVEKITPYSSWDKEPKYKLIRDTLELKLYYSHSLRVILNTINIFVNDTIEAQEIYQKCWDLLKSGEKTFVYRNVKITCYENGKIKLVFAEKTILEKMTELLKRVKPQKEEI